MTRCPRCQTEVPDNCKPTSLGEYLALSDEDKLKLLLPQNRHVPPTPASLRELAEWFDNPKNPSMTINFPIGFHGPTGEYRKTFTPGYLLRRIADELERGKR